ncbi:MAG TPA: hypothetical protein VK986_13025 [Tepidisphaeraceae bacterium]|nr:hypothetical protein [Tepidisphaeraceae bacterium]
MARPGATLDHLFDRPYRPGSTYGPRISPIRRWGMLLVLFLLVSVIFTYWYLTDARRVRAMAERYLSDLTGGKVEVRSATLSIFEGLRLDGVTIHAADPEGMPDSRLFSAETFLVKYSPQSILSGKLEATQIVALDPQVFLCEDLDRGRWNWQRAGPDKSATTQESKATPRMKFPEILLRNVRVNYTRLRGGKLLTERGLIEIEGALRPDPDNAGALSFRLQSRGEVEAIGPAAEGRFDLDTRELVASLKHFKFGKDIEVMLPEQVRNWWVEHGLSGSLDIPAFYVKPGVNGGKPKFRIETDLKNVTLAITPDEWLSRDDVRRLAGMRRSVALMKSLGMDSAGLVSHLEGSFVPHRTELEKVAGRFVFTEDGIDVDNVTGWIEKNPFKINGRIGGYTPQVPVDLTVVGDNVTIPAAPRYVNSLPPEARELYDHLRPEGDGSLRVSIKRKTAGAKPVIAGQLDIIDGRFCFDLFAYPLRKVTGRIKFGWNEQRQMDCVEVEHVRGLGIVGGPNKDVPVDVRGFVGPLGKDAGAHFVITAGGVTQEPALLAAMPRAARDALKLFDAEGQGRFPQFKGRFECTVDRPVGPDQKWAIRVDVGLDAASGALVFFPLPVENLTGKLHITDEQVLIRDVRVTKGDAELALDGEVYYGKDAAGHDKPVDSRIRLTAKNLPLDADLLAALPAERREWIKTLGIGGKIDLSGRIEPDRAAKVAKGAKSLPLTYDLDLTLKDAGIWPVDGTPTLTGVTAQMKLTPGMLDVTHVSGKRGKADVTGSGRMTFAPGARPTIKINGSAKNLLLDAALYKALPPAWREGWDQLRPDGTVDVAVKYECEGPAEAPPAGTTKPVVAVASVGPATPPDPVTPAPAPAMTTTFEAVIKPVKLSVTPKALPVKLADVTGEVVITPEQIAFKDVTAKRPSGGTLALSGTAAPAKDGAAGAGAKRTAWEFALSAKDVVNDKELRQALPPGAGKLLGDLKVEGKLSAAFSRIGYVQATSAKADDGELAFVGKLMLADNTLDVGMPLTGVTGVIAMEGTARGGKLGALRGTLDLDTLNFADRKLTDVKAELLKPEAGDALRVGKVSGKIAGGNLDGQIDLIFPETGPSRFGLGLVLRNADVKTLVGQGDQDIKGKLTASLAIEGNWGDVTSRRGRGDVQVVGREMYQIPLVLGLASITNLTLPISSPFNEGAARYTVEGERVNFEAIELRASNMLMSGHGWLDFASRKVRMTFTTDNPNAWKIPFVHEILQGARQELLQIHVTGSVTEPKVSAGVMSTFGTTVDEVFRGDKPPASRRGK